jgi:hypothetical protein
MYAYKRVRSIGGCGSRGVRSNCISKVVQKSTFGIEPKFAIFSDFKMKIKWKR